MSISILQDFVNRLIGDYAIYGGVIVARGCFCTKQEVISFLDQIDNSHYVDSVHLLVFIDISRSTLLIIQDRICSSCYVFDVQLAILVNIARSDFHPSFFVTIVIALRTLRIGDSDT